jgi:hypothetical protein
VDPSGAAAALVIAWSHGVSYTFGADGRLLAFGSQHDVEVWHLGQRALFHEIDHALHAASSPLTHPLSFAWWDDGLWDELEEGEDRGDPTMTALR